MAVGEGVFIIERVIVIVNKVIPARRDLARQIDVGGADPGIQISDHHTCAEKAGIPRGHDVDTGQIGLVKVLARVDVRGRPGSTDAEGKERADGFCG